MHTYIHDQPETRAPHGGFRRWRLAVLSAALVVLACTTTPRRHAPAMDAVVTRVEVVDISYTDVALMAHLDVRNPGLHGATVPGYRWAMSLGDLPEVTGGADDPLMVPPDDTRSLSFPVALHFAQLAAAQQAEAARGVPYTLRVQVGEDAAWLTHDGMLHLPVAPDVYVAAVWVRQLSWYEATVQLDLNITPRTGGRLELRALDCELALDGVPAASFTLDHTNVPIATDARIPLTQHVRLGSGGQPVAAILQRAEARYRLRGYAALYAHGFGVLRLPIDDAGVIPLQPPGI